MRRKERVFSVMFFLNINSIVGNYHYLICRARAQELLCLAKIEDNTRSLVPKELNEKIDTNA